jgi:hypothetical protein
LQFGEALLDPLGELGDRHRTMRLPIGEDVSQRWIVTSVSSPQAVTADAPARETKAIVPLPWTA